MNTEEIIRILKEQRERLSKEYGVKSLMLFGSLARREATPTSDVDLLVEFNRPVGYFGLFALQNELERLLGCPVDLGTLNSLKPYLRESIQKDLVHVA